MSTLSTILPQVLTTIVQTPGAWQLFSSHISQSDMMRAIGDLDGMTVANAGIMASQIKSIRGFPPAAAAYLDAAVQAANAGNQAAFAQNITEAKVELAKAGSSQFSNIFGNL